MKLPKLHIRDLFWLMLAVGLALGWWMERGRMTQRQVRSDGLVRAAWELLRAQGWEIYTYDRAIEFRHKDHPSVMKDLPYYPPELRPP